MKRLDSYILRQMFGPFALCLALITLILVMQRTLKLMEMIINKGIPASFFLLFLFYLLPSLLVLSIPMAVLVSILMTFSRMSADSETVAMRATGISLFRMQRPALIFGVLGWLLSSAIMLYLLPYANRSAKEMIYEMALKHAHSQIEPRVFYDKFKEVVIYVDEKLPAESDMRGVFVSHMGEDMSQRVMVASRGRLISDDKHEQIFLQLLNGSVHELSRSHADRYTVSSFQAQDYPIFTELTAKKMDKEVPKTHREMKVSELREQIEGNLIRAEAAKAAYEEALAKGPSEELTEKSIEALKRTSEYRQWLYNSSRVELHKKLSLPFACVVFALLGVPLGIFSRHLRRGGSVGSSLLFFLVYYVLLSTGEDLGDSGSIPPFLSMWLPNIVLGLFALILVYYSATERRPRVWALLSDAVFAGGSRIKSSLVKLGMVRQPGWPRTGGFRLPSYFGVGQRARFPRLLDRYVASRFMRIMWIVAGGLVAVFCVVRFFEVLDDVMEHKSGLGPALEFVVLSLPQLIFWVLPVGVLVTAMMTINLMSRSNELTVLLAGGTSLQRVSAAMLIIAFLASVLAFTLNEFIVPYTNKEADRVWQEEINKRKKKGKFAEHTVWYKGTGKRIYNIDYIDQSLVMPSVQGMTIFEFDDNFQIKRILRADSAYFDEGKWFLENVDLKQITETGPRSDIMERLVLPLEETPADFIKSRPNPEEMSYDELSRYIKELKSAGYSYRQYQTDLMNKIALPLIAFIIALLAIPMGATARKSGRLVGLGAAIGIAGVFFLIHSSFISLGHSGRIPHFLAAWAANILFATVGVLAFTHAKT